MREKNQSAEFRRTLVQEFEESALTQPDFARKKEVNLGTFRGWLYKTRADKQKQEVEFLEVKELPLPTNSTVSMFLPHELMIEFETCPDARFVASLVHELSKLPC